MAAASCEVAVEGSGESDGGSGGFESWLDGWLDTMGIDQAIYRAYILGVLKEEEEDEEKLDALLGILSAFLEDDFLLNTCREIVERWSETQNAFTKVKKQDEVQTIVALIEKQAQIVVKPRKVSDEEKKRKAALLARYGVVTDEEDEPNMYDSAANMMTIGVEKSLFRNTNVEDVFKAWKLERDSLQDKSQWKKEQEQLKRDREKLAKQERKEKKRMQRLERKR